MNSIKFVLAAVAALAISTPALAGADLATTVQKDRAVKQLNAAKGLAGPVGPQGLAGPGTQRYPATVVGHPSERVRR